LTVEIGQQRLCPNRVRFTPISRSMYWPSRQKLLLVNALCILLGSDAHIRCDKESGQIMETTLVGTSVSQVEKPCVVGCNWKERTECRVNTNS